MACNNGPSQEQRLYLVTYMETHSLFSQREFYSDEGRAEIKQRWKKLAEELNIVGGPQKTSEQWQAVGSLILKRNVFQQACVSLQG